jgi:pentatricopeptide repeat protein
MENQVHSLLHVSASFPYLTVGNMKQALEVFARMKRMEVPPNALTYTTLIDSYRANEGMGKALEVLQLMEKVC